MCNHDKYREAIMYIGTMCTTYVRIVFFFFFKILQQKKKYEQQFAQKVRHHHFNNLNQTIHVIKS